MTPVSQLFSVSLMLDPVTIYQATRRRAVAECWLEQEIDDALAVMRREMRAWGEKEIDVAFPAMPTIPSHEGANMSRLAARSKP